LAWQEKKEQERRNIIVVGLATVSIYYYFDADIRSLFLP
jgi:hypothetical protein